MSETRLTDEQLAVMDENAACNCDCTACRHRRALLVEVRELRRERDLLLETTADVVAQGCWVSNSGTQLDSGCLSSYADALHVLADFGRVEIVSSAGRMVTARWKETEKP